MPRNYRDHSYDRRSEDRSTHRNRDHRSSRDRHDDHRKDTHSDRVSGYKDDHSRSKDRHHHRSYSSDRNKHSESTTHNYSTKRVDNSSIENKKRYNQPSMDSKINKNSNSDREVTISNVPEQKNESNISNNPQNTLQTFSTTISNILPGNNKTKINRLEGLASLEQSLQSISILQNYPKVATPVSPLPVSPLASLGNIPTNSSVLLNSTIIKPEATFLINKKDQKIQSINPYLVDDSKLISKQSIMDPRLKMSLHNRKETKRLQFMQQGEATRKAEQEKNKFFRQTISQATKIVNNEEAVTVESSFAPIASSSTPVETSLSTQPINSTSIGTFVLPPSIHSETPQIEWWDRVYLPEDMRTELQKSHDTIEGIDYSKCSFENCELKHLIYHPVPIDRTKDDKVITLPSYLTKEEQKKQRRATRAKKIENERLLIQAGLLAPPPAKLNLRNYKVVLKDEAMLNPTATEQKVRKEIEARKQAAQEENEKRKLSPEERKVKMLKKIVGKKEDELYVSVYRVNSLANPQIKFKVTVNASQLFLNGIALSVPTSNCCCIYVEGTKKAIKRYHKLMTRRIQWNKSLQTDENDENNENDENQDEQMNDTNTITTPTISKNGCVTIWQGVLKNSHFNRFTYEQYDNTMDARKVLEQKGLTQYWDSCINYSTELESLF